MDLSIAANALKKYFGYDQFRPMQAEIIQALYQGRDALVLMPTGGGKSICYQIPAITLPGSCLVVSPLISLMKDQVESLRANGVRAAYLNSSLDAAAQRQVEDAFYSGQLDILYVSPEKLASQVFLPLLQRSQLNLIAIDEAHCISAWGHDFRPEYTQLAFLKRQFPKVPIIALTATADKLTRGDIIQQLNLREPNIFIASFDRPNLRLEVRAGQNRNTQIIDFIRQHPNQSGIIYCLSRRGTEQVAETLKKAGIPAAFYHAGLPDAERSRVQEAFINDQIPIIAATIAFGMGIDKSNVRWVIHYNLPKNLEGYYQEIGRAGRDGARADTVLFFSYNDVSTLQDIISSQDNPHNDLQLAKLDRMREYAESMACRRRILLAYFGEDFPGNCGNCDMCKNPPQYFDGTVLAQKALSAVFRLREQVGANMLIAVLRGSGSKEVLEKGYQKIKTYGSGRDLSSAEWQFYLRQLVNLGYLEVAYQDHQSLKLTEASRRVLFEKEPVQLVRLATLKEHQESAREKLKPQAQRQRVRDELFEVLRQLRLRIARQQGVPPYIVFSDATLEEMAATRPLTEDQMRRISGVGEHKMREYAEPFIEAIREFTNGAPAAGKPSTLQLTYDLYRQGLNLDEMAQQRGLSRDAIIDHLFRLRRDGKEIDFFTLISPDKVQRVKKLIHYMEMPRLKEIYEGLDGELEYYQIKLALACLGREN